MKIGFFTDGYLPQLNGVAISVDACARALEKRGHEVYIVAPQFPGVKKEKDVIRIPSFKWPELPEIRLATFLPGKSLILASKLDVDIVHGHAGGPLSLLGWEVAKLKRVPYVATYHTLWNQYMHYILQGKVIKPKMAEIASKIFGNLCDTLVVPTKKVEEELLSYGIDKPVYVIPNGLDLDRFSTSQSGWLRANYNLSSSTKVLLYVGRLGKEKSIDYLFKALEYIQKDESDTVLVLVGEGPYEKNLKDLVMKSNLSKKVIFTGPLPPDTAARVYKDADLFVFASRTETQGMVVPEAMASGLPVVTMKDDAFTTYIEHKKSGILVSGSPKEFAKEVVALLRDTPLRTAISKEGKKRVQHYSSDAVAEQLEKIYLALINENDKKADSPFKLLSKYLLSQDK